MTKERADGQAVWSANAARLAEMLEEAAAAPRLRTHLLIHESPDDQVQRLLIAAIKGTYVRPHVHSHQWEVLVLLRGAGRLLQFSPEGRIESVMDMAQDQVNVAQIGAGASHGFAVTGDHAVVMEIKPGPYRPNEFAPWAPAEGSDDATRFVGWSLTAGAGNDWSSG